MRSASQIRKEFIDFFTQKCGHAFVPSSPVVPFDDATLLFANAGMNQFKPYFLGTEQPQNRRVANTQKCIRAGGKHNDLDDVGKDTYHHTFFEMLGNWSFGDYFKKEAITWAWELLTEVWKLDKTRLHVTVFEGDPSNNVPRDDEAAQIWRDVGVPDDHIHLGNKKDNFWEMGDTGPCGPCTEIHIDKTPGKTGGKLVNAGVPEVMEIWNLVFIQFNRNADRTLTPLPAKHVDTGMGFERVASVIQGMEANDFSITNYDTDVFSPIFDEIRKVTNAPAYGRSLTDLKDIAYRVIADHIRLLTFALTDGGTPGNLGRGYVIRSVLRRASRYGWQQFGMKEPFLHKLVNPLVAQMGEAFPELKRNPEKVREAIYDEESSFLKTLERGLKLFNDAALEAKKIGSESIDSKTAFDLHTEQGVFIDITQQMAEEAGLKVDRHGYEKLIVEFKDKSRQGMKKLVVSAIKGNLPKTDDSPKYATKPINAKVVGWVKDNAVIAEGTLQAGDAVAVLLDVTNFYGEQGGQVGDVGSLKTADGALFDVEDTQRLGDAILHIGELKEGRLKVGDTVEAVPATMRRFDIMRNHTATHLLNLGLRRVLGNHVDQKGSLVDAEKTRFDFSHDKPISPEELRKIEEEVNSRIMEDLPVTRTMMPLADAKKLPGVRAMFGEKYPDPVRVVMIADDPTQLAFDDSVEFCGGTHLDTTGSIGIFKIVSQEGTAKGVRRLTALTGRAALAHVETITGVVNDAAGKLNCKIEELPTRIEALQKDLKELQAKLQKAAAGDMQAVADKLLENPPMVNGARVIVGEMPNGPEDALRQQLDSLRQKAGSAVVVIGWKIDDANVGFLAAVTDDLVSRGLKAGELVGKVAEIAGGKGGGKPNMARAGGKQPAKLAEALAAAEVYVREKLK